MKLILKNIVFNKHFKFKRYNNKFINSIVKLFLHLLFPEVLNISEPIKLDKNNNFNISKFGIKIYSQNEEDGILLYILKHIGIKTKKFVEIGVENGTECNTTNLLKNFNWKGIQIEGNKKLYNDESATWISGWKEYCDHMNKKIIFHNNNEVVKGLFLDINDDGNINIVI